LQSNGEPFEINIKDRSITIATHHDGYLWDTPLSTQQLAVRIQKAIFHADVTRDQLNATNATQDSVTTAAAAGFGNGLAQGADNLAGFATELADSSADLTVAIVNTAGNLVALSMNVVASPYFVANNTPEMLWFTWPELQRPGRLSEFATPPFGKQEAFAQGQVIGHYTVRAAEVAGAAYGAVQFVLALPGLAASVESATTSTVSLNLPAQFAGGIVLVDGVVIAVPQWLTASASGALGAAGAVTGAFDPLSDHFTQSPGENITFSTGKGAQNPNTSAAIKIGQDYDRRFRTFWRRFEGQTIGDGIEVAYVNRRIAQGVQPDLVLIASCG